MKLFMALNMHYSLPELFTKPEVTLSLKRDKSSVTPDLDQHVVELTFDVPEKEIVNQKEYINPSELAPGLYDNGYQWVFKGDPAKITNTRTVVKARLPVVQDIPRVSMLVVIDRDVLNLPNWWCHSDVTAAIERYKPKWGAKGYVFNKVGNDKVRIDYVPITVNPTAVATLLTSLMTFAEQTMEQLPSIVTDHGSKQDLLDL